MGLFTISYLYFLYIQTLPKNQSPPRSLYFCKANLIQYKLNVGRLISDFSAFFHIYPAEAIIKFVANDQNLNAAFPGLQQICKCSLLFAKWQSFLFSIVCHTRTRIRIFSIKMIFAMWLRIELFQWKTWAFWEKWEFLLETWIATLLTWRSS